MQVTYDKLVTTNVFSKHFGECRDGKIELGQDTTLTIRGEATRYQVCHGSLHDNHLLVAAVGAFLHQLLPVCYRKGQLCVCQCCQATGTAPIASVYGGVR